MKIPMYLGNCEELGCEHFQWSGDSCYDRGTICYCLLNGKGVIRREAKEERIICPMGKMMDEEDDEEDE